MLLAVRAPMNKRRTIRRTLFALLGSWTALLLADIFVGYAFDKALIVFGLPPGRHCTSIASGEGFLQVYLDWTRSGPDHLRWEGVINSDHTDGEQRSIITLRANGEKRFGGVSFYHVSIPALGSIDSVAIPEWWLVLAALPPLFLVCLMMLRDRQIGRRIRDGECTSCGYDLRASDERCPECGASIAPFGLPSNWGHPLR
jgi:hypothetical protein